MGGLSESTFQFLRLLKSSDSKSLAHISYWIGDGVADLLPGADAGPHPTKIHDYYNQIEFLLVHGRVDDLIQTGIWRTVTNRMIYSKKIESLPSPRVEIVTGRSFKISWLRITLPILEPKLRDISYMLLHNKLPVKERLFRVGMSTDSFCSLCPGSHIGDVQHFFVSCDMVSSAWTKVHFMLNSLLGVNVPPYDLLHYLFPSSPKEREVVWLLGNYVGRIWDDLYVKSSKTIDIEEFFGYLTFKYKSDQFGAKIPLGVIPGL